MATQTEEAKTRKHFLHWIGYLMRDHESNEVDFMQLLNKEYHDWGQKVLGEPRCYHSYYGERPCDYMRRAVRAASLAQLQDLRAIRYILDHPVPNGVAYSGNCARVEVPKVLPYRFRAKAPALAATHTPASNS